jgi:hypothetical protein
LCLKVPPPLCNNFLEVFRTKTNTVIYNQELNLRLNRMIKVYARDIASPLPLYFPSETSGTKSLPLIIQCMPHEILFHP